MDRHAQLIVAFAARLTVVCATAGSTLLVGRSVGLGAVALLAATALVARIAGNLAYGASLIALIGESHGRRGGRAPVLAFAAACGCGGAFAGVMLTTVGIQGAATTAASLVAGTLAPRLYFNLRGASIGKAQAGAQGRAALLDISVVWVGGAAGLVVLGPIGLFSWIVLVGSGIEGMRRRRVSSVDTDSQPRVAAAGGMSGSLVAFVALRAPLLMGGGAGLFPTLGVSPDTAGQLVVVQRFAAPWAVALSALSNRSMSVPTARAIRWVGRSGRVAALAGFLPAVALVLLWPVVARSAGLSTSDAIPTAAVAMVVAAQWVNLAAGPIGVLLQRLELTNLDALALATASVLLVAGVAVFADSARMLGATVLVVSLSRNGLAWLLLAHSGVGWSDTRQRLGGVA